LYTPSDEKLNFCLIAPPGAEFAFSMGEPYSPNLDFSDLKLYVFLVNSLKLMPLKRVAFAMDAS
jgi:hypothetical protein